MGIFDSIGSGLRKVGSGIKNTVVGAGHLVGEVASNPVVQGLTAAGLAATGVGVPAAAAIMAAERGGGKLLAPGGNIGQAARGGVEGAAMGAGASLLGSGVRRVVGAIGARGAGAVTDPRTGLPTGGGDAVPGDGMDPAYDPVGSDGGSGGGSSIFDGALGAVRKVGTGVLTGQTGGGGFWDAAGNYIKNNVGNIVTGGLAAEQGLAAAKASARASEMSDKALGIAQDNWNQGADLRTAGKSGLLNRTTHDLTDVYGTNKGPFAGKRRKVVV